MADLIWKNKESELFAQTRLFSVHRQWSEVPDGHAVYDIYVLKLSNWANVIAITPEQEVVFVKQYRHGVGKVTLEIPGGVIDAEDKEPVQAAERELFEETGYRSKDLIFLGDFHPNPALQNNQCYVYLAQDVLKVSEPTFDAEGFEYIEVCLVPLSKIPQLIADGDITHGAVISAFHLLHLYENRHKRTEENGPLIVA
jgi:8-oxo-dGTP pyrophosphatase MutT (NUDIX family)